MEFDAHASSFSCLFSAGNLESSPKSCKIIYGYRDPITDSCLLLITVQNSTNNNMSDTVTVFIPNLEHTDSDSEICFTAIGITAGFTVAVEGTFKTGTHSVVYHILLFSNHSFYKDLAMAISWSVMNLALPLEYPSVLALQLSWWSFLPSSLS